MPRYDPPPMSRSGAHVRLLGAAPPAPPPAPQGLLRGVAWPAVAVAVTLLVHLVALIAWLAVVENRVAVLEQQIPPGAVARLEERVDTIKATVERIDRRLDDRRREGIGPG